MIVRRCLVAAMVLAGSAHAAPRLTGEQEVERALAGRVAGAPTQCIYQRDIRSSTIVGGTAILYRMTDGTIFLNRPASGGAFLRFDTILVTDTRSPRLCRIDIVRLIDRGARMQQGTLGLGDFIPYRKPDRG